MNAAADAQLLRQLEAAQRGVFSKGDLQTAFAEPHPAAFARRVNALLQLGALRRFCRGWYVSEEFDLATLSQRIAPESYISFSTVLARHLIVGSSPEGSIAAIKTGRSRRYSSRGVVVEHLGLAARLVFGYSATDGVRYADPEKAFLDTLYFHVRGRRFPFDIYSDLALNRLRIERIQDYLQRYRNPRFVAFVRGVLTR